MPADTNAPCDQPRSWSRWLPFLVLVFAFVAAPFIGSTRSAEAGPDAAAPDDEALRAGAEVFTEACASCHQPGGVGLPGQFPPLVNNPNVDDAEYLEDVIRNGLTGEIVVNGEIFNTPMPPPPALSDAEVASLITYIQSGFATPAPVVDPAFAADTESSSTGRYINLGLAIAFGLAVLLLSPRWIAAHDRREITWLDAWLKAVVIVVGLIVSIVIVPAKVIELGAVQDMPRIAQDLITVGIWSGALVTALFVLWYAHRERRV